jgi:hypothetical protein
MGLLRSCAVPVWIRVQYVGVGLEYWVVATNLRLGLHLPSAHAIADCWRTTEQVNKVAILATSFVSAPRARQKFKTRRSQAVS